MIKIWMMNIVGGIYQWLKHNLFFFSAQKPVYNFPEGQPHCTLSTPIGDFQQPGPVLLFGFQVWRIVLAVQLFHFFFNWGLFIRATSGLMVNTTSLLLCLSKNMIHDAELRDGPKLNTQSFLPTAGHLRDGKVTGCHHWQSYRQCLLCSLQSLISITSDISSSHRSIITPHHPSPVYPQLACDLSSKP